MEVRTASAQWKGDLVHGSGTVELGSGLFSSSYTFASRFEDGTGTNPEELIGAAHAGCFSMALAGALGRAGHAPKSINTIARVRLEKTGEGFAITGIDLESQADVPGIDDETFQRLAAGAKDGCPVSKALTGTTIALRAILVSGHY